MSWSDERLQVYLAPGEIGPDGYPYAWHAGQRVIDMGEGVKQLIRRVNGYRCERCHHPFPPGVAGEWSPCDEHCTHGGPMRLLTTDGWEPFAATSPREAITTAGWVGAPIEAQWRILTVHHLNGVKHDLRWWNLAALCQRCHLTIQGKVRMERAFHGEHSEWFKPHAAGWYAWSFFGVDISRDEAIERMDELLALEHRQENLW